MSKISAFRIVADGRTQVRAYDALRRSEAGPWDVSTRSSRPLGETETA